MAPICQLVAMTVLGHRVIEALYEHAEVYWQHQLDVSSLPQGVMRCETTQQLIDVVAPSTNQTYDSLCEAYLLQLPKIGC